MITGAETPITGSILAGAKPGAGGAVFVSAQALGNNSPSVSHEYLSDTVELSTDAHIRLQKVQNVLNQGRGGPEKRADAAREEQIKSFLQSIEEFQQNLDDENRLPPSIIKQIEKLLQAALQPKAGPQVNALA